MIRRTKEGRKDKGLAVQLIVGLVFLVTAILLFLVFEPVFNTLDTASSEQLNGTYYEDEAGNLLTFLNVFSGTGLLVIPVLMFTVFLVGRAIFLTQFR